MSPGEIQWLANHLGHDMTTHKNNYRMHAPAIEITKVGKLLMAIDNNDGAFVNKRMNKLLHDGPGDDFDMETKSRTRKVEKSTKVNKGLCIN